MNPKCYIEKIYKLTKEQKELLKQLQESMEGSGDKHSPRKKGWFDGVKQFFDDMKL